MSLPISESNKPECFGAYYEGPKCDICPLVNKCVEYENSDEDDQPEPMELDIWGNPVGREH